MAQLSHLDPINLPGYISQPEVLYLADAFSEFISASTRLETSYGQLQLEVAHLSHQLAERNSALKASMEENARVHSALQQIVDSMPCGVLVVEADGVVSMINPECKRLLNLGAGRADQLQAISVQAGIDLNGFLKRHAGEDDEQEFCCVSEAGKRWLSVHDRCLFSGDGASREQTILILRDVTMHKQAEAEREMARKATALSEVATTLAHEIRNPLASLELFAGLIAEGGPETKEWIGHLYAGIRSLSGTVNNVLSFHGVGYPSLHPLNLSEAVRSSVEFVRPIADEAGVVLTFVAAEPVIMVRANSSAIQQVVLNLVCNAIRHTRKDGCVNVSLRLNDTAVIEFSDTGCGIATELLEEIFRPGFSGSGTTSGLGLAVCSQIVKQHDGTIRVTSVPGSGTTFCVEVPTL
jgi:two-component system sensor histidine kinase FlrB